MDGGAWASSANCTEGPAGPAASCCPGRCRLSSGPHISQEHPDPAPRPSSLQRVPGWSQQQLWQVTLGMAKPAGGCVPSGCPGQSGNRVSGSQVGTRPGGRHRAQSGPLSEISVPLQPLCPSPATCHFWCNCVIRYRGPVVCVRGGACACASCVFVHLSVCPCVCDCVYVSASLCLCVFVCLCVCMFL